MIAIGQRPRHASGDGLQLPHGGQSVTLHSAANRRGGGESTQ